MDQVEVGYTPPISAEQHAAAIKSLRKNLEAFAFDALIQLEEDLREGLVTRGTWDGCVLSYRSGDAGSVSRDVDGQARNAFTILWDRRWMSMPEVLRYVNVEIVRRVPEWTVPKKVETMSLEALHESYKIAQDLGVDEPYAFTGMAVARLEGAS